MTTGLDVARDESLTRFKDALAARRLPPTPQRIAVARIVLGAEKPLSAEDVAERLRQVGPAPGIATIYRTLDLIVDCGLATTSEDPREGFRRFAPLRDDISSTELLCTGCGAVEMIADEVTRPRLSALADALGFVTVRHRTVVYGHCARCAALRNTTREAR